MTRTTSLVLLLALLVIGGCGGDSAADEAMADVCGARDDIARNVDELAGLTASSATKAQVTDNLQSIRDALARIGDAQEELSEDRRQQVRDANDAFVRTVRETASAVGRTASLESASADIKGALTELESTYRDTLGTIDCT